MSLDTKDRAILNECSEIALSSLDPRHKVGCIIMAPGGFTTRSRGFNRMPEGIANTHERWHNKELKRSLVVHAEEAAILNSPERVNGCTLYSTYRPCLSCARLILEAGILRVVWAISNPNYPSPEHLFQEAGVQMAWKEQS